MTPNTNELKLLEERITFCEQFLETLNGVVIDLQKRLQNAEIRNVRLAEEVRRLREITAEPLPENERPPHY